MRRIPVTLLCVLAVAVSVGGAHYAGGRKGHRDDHDDKGMYCSYYFVDVDGTKHVGSMHCEDDCCGTMENRTCCGDGSDEDDDDDSPSGRQTVTFVLVGVLAMAILAVLVSCVFWFYKKAKAKRCKTYHSDRFKSTARAPGVAKSQANPIDPPKYSPPEGGRDQIYSLFTIQSPPPAYAVTPSGPPAYDLADPPPYSPKKTAGNKDDASGTVTSPPPPYA